FQKAVDSAVEDADRDDATTTDIGAGVEEVHAEEDDDHGHDHGHDHGNEDPHVWLDPQNMVAAAESVRDALVEADPDNADAYEANAQELVTELESLDSDFKTGLAKCERSVFVTSHAAFGHLAHAYDLTQLPISGVD